jgi:hypothetical protein
MHKKLLSLNIMYRERHYVEGWKESFDFGKIQEKKF